ncbi:MAG: hypothetical protein AAFY28_04395 [Actinomycetota bacterium]
MFFWFIATAVFTVGWVFRDPRFDYRMLMVGSVLPLIDGLFGGARALYSVVTAIAVLVVVMLATIGRRQLRRFLLGLPIGMILHLVFSAAWDDTDVFWWPLTGLSFDGDPPLPVVAHGWWSVVLELIGIVGCVVLWRNNDLASSQRRAEFIRTGHLDVAVRH